jgi:hypothetical protein
MSANADDGHQSFWLPLISEVSDQIDCANRHVVWSIGFEFTL